MKMMFQCGCCGRLEALNIEGTAEQVEAELDRIIDTEGWRWVKRWQGCVCGGCRSKGYDPLYETYAGRPKASTKTTSYKKLLEDAKEYYWRYFKGYTDRRLSVMRWRDR